MRVKIRARFHLDLKSHDFCNRRVFVVLPAAGCGSRMQSDRPKQYLPLGDSGQTVLQTTVLALLDVPEIDGIYVAVSPEDQYVDSLAIRPP